MSVPLRPKLRAVETIFVPDPAHGQVLVQIVARMTGASTCAEIAAEVQREIKTKVPVAIVLDLARELDEAGFLEGETFEARLLATKRAFSERRWPTPMVSRDRRKR